MFLHVREEEQIRGLRRQASVVVCNLRIQWDLAFGDVNVRCRSGQGNVVEDWWPLVEKNRGICRCSAHSDGKKK